MRESHSSRSWSTTSTPSYVESESMDTRCTRRSPITMNEITTSASHTATDRMERASRLCSDSTNTPAAPAHPLKHGRSSYKTLLLTSRHKRLGQAQVGSVATYTYALAGAEAVCGAPPGCGPGDPLRR